MQSSLISVLLLSTIKAKMLHRCKMLPIHSDPPSKGKLINLNQHLKRNHSLQSTYRPIESSHQSGTSEPRKYKPRTAAFLARAHRSHINTPANFITNFSPVATESDIRKKQNSRNRPSPIKKEAYLSRKVLQKQMLQSYIDSVFHKVSMIRTSQPIRSYRRKRSQTRSTLTTHIHYN